MSEHKVTISGTACQIEGGMVLLGGTAYAIESGQVLVDGTICDIPFEEVEAGPVTITITGNPNSTKAYATINGENISTKGTYEYSSMPTISVYVYGTGDGEASTYVKLNGTKVLSGPGTYTLNVVASTITIKFSYSQRLTPSVYYISNAQITTS